MKRVNKFGLMAFLFAIVLMTSFVSAAVESTKNNYTSTETIYARSTTQLCNNVPKDANVSLYIVENQDEWSAGDVLNDVRGEPQDVPNTQFSSKKVWESPYGGFFDIVVDCLDNAKFDALEPIDGAFDIGFTVTAVAGKGKASIGDKDKGDHFWMYDSEEPDLINEILQLNLLAEGEDIILDTMSIKAVGTGNDVEITNMEVYIDENNDGMLDEDEVKIGESEPAYSENNGISKISLDYVLTRDFAENILIVYTMKKELSAGEFSLTVESILGTGENSEQPIEFSGVPLNSGITTILPQKTCLGKISIDLDPNPADKGDSVKVTVEGLEGCEDEKITLRINPCGSSIQEEISSCIIGEDQEGCEMNFNASASETYHVCIDKNKDGDMIDFGEYAFEDLILNEPVVPVDKGNETKKDNITGGIDLNISDEVVDTTSPITGSVIEDLQERIAETGSFFILLEITLLLILFVLIMILFKLRGPVVVERAAEQEKEDEDEED